VRTRTTVRVRAVRLELLLAPSTLGAAAPREAASLLAIFVGIRLVTTFSRRPLVLMRQFERGAASLSQLIHERWSQTLSQARETEYSQRRMAQQSRTVRPGTTVRVRSETDARAAMAAAMCVESCSSPASRRFSL
jgi:hypothetical protein